MKKRNNKTLAVVVKNLTKKYVLHHQKPTFAEHILKRSQRQVFTAVNKLSLSVHAGERIGIIGANGSGKTTLLKLIAGITQPNSGTIQVTGKVVSLIGLDAGFHQDLSGEENIYLNGLIIGMTRQEISDQFEKIVAFSGIGEFIDVPLFTYSYGMKLRLGFAIAVHSNPDILLLDEGIAAGDHEFQLQAEQKLKEFIRQGKTVLIVSHYLSLLKKYCSRIVWLDHGKIKKDGNVRVLNAYINHEKK